MIPGFNHNIQYNGRIFHVQTEDSGLKNPHVITHVFVGGNIMASRKTSYREFVGAGNLEDLVREMMQVQHKEMLRQVIRGAYDDLNGAQGIRLETSEISPDIVAKVRSASSPEIPAAQVPPAAPKPQVSRVPAPPSPPPPRPLAAQPAAVPAKPAPAPQPPAKPPAPAPAAKAPPPTLAPIAGAPRAVRPAAVQPQQPPLQASAAPPAARPAAPAAAGAPQAKTTSPALAVRGPVAAPQAAPRPAPPSAPQPRRPVAAPAARQVSTPGAPSGIRPATVAPTLDPDVIAARELKEKPIEKPAATTLFGEMLSEKSLDEVILSYLSQDPKSG